MKHLGILSSLLLILMSLVPAFAGGPVYSDLPDLEGREVVVAVENFYMPFQFVDARSDDPIGFEYDVVNEVCNRINCTPVYETTTFELQLTGVAQGQYDMAMNGLFITEDRKENYDFSIPYIQAETYLLVRADEDRFTGIDDFVAKAESEDLIFGVQSNSFSQVIANEIYGVAESQVVTYDEFGVLLVSLANGDIDTMAVDAFAGKFVSNTGDAFKLIGDPVVDPVDMGLLFQKGSDLVEPFNGALESMQEDGYMDYLYYKWSTHFVPLAE